jgi:hypothetical protein
MTSTARAGILQIVGEIMSERDFDQVDICGQSLEIADETGETVLSAVRGRRTRALAGCARRPLGVLVV